MLKACWRDNAKCYSPGKEILQRYFISPQKSPFVLGERHRHFEYDRRSVHRASNASEGVHVHAARRVISAELNNIATWCKMDKPLIIELPSIDRIYDSFGSLEIFMVPIMISCGICLARFIGISDRNAKMAIDQTYVLDRHGKHIRFRSHHRRSESRAHSSPSLSVGRPDASFFSQSCTQTRLCTRTHTLAKLVV